MAINLGGLNIAAMKLGATDVAKAYLGSTEVYTASNIAFVADLIVSSGSDSRFVVVCDVGDIIDMTINGSVSSTTVTNGFAEYTFTGNTGTVLKLEIYGTPTRVSFSNLSSGYDNIKVTKMSTITSMVSFAVNIPQLDYVHFNGLVTSQVTEFNNCIVGNDALTCIDGLDTTGKVSATDVIIEGNSVVAPTASEITQLESAGGFNYVNAGNCP